MAVPSINDLKMWVGTLFTKDDWDFNFSKIVSWLSDGKGDLVVNTVKASNGIDLDGAQLSNVGVATTGTDAINLDQATTLLNQSSSYFPFSVASGKVDSNGYAAYIQKDSDSQVTVLAGNTNPDLVCIQSDGTIETVTANKVLTVPGSDGTYHIIKEKESAISLTSGSTSKITIDKKFPTVNTIGDYFLDNSVLPFKGYKYTADGWEEVAFCWLGDVTVSSGTATVKQFVYNDNKFNVAVTERYKSGQSWYRVYADGWCEQGGYVSGSTATLTFLKSFVDTNYSISATAFQNSGYTPTAWVYANPTTSGVEIHGERWAAVEYTDSVTGFYWEVKGYIR